jgi:hypothetical protein
MYDDLKIKKTVYLKISTVQKINETHPKTSFSNAVEEIFNEIKTGDKK